MNLRSSGKDEQIMPKRKTETTIKTNAEIQKSYRERMKAKGYTARLVWVKAGEPTPAQEPQAADTAATERAAWQEELKKEQLTAARKAGRESEQRKQHEKAFVSGVCWTALFMIRHGRPDIARHILSEAYIDRNRAAAAIEKPSMATLDKSNAWDKPETLVRL